jgi:tetratricopeptide (TPR) repeat protein
VLEGSVRRSGTRLRVTAQLITAADGTHVWSQRYDRELADVFAVQDEIAQAIAAALKVKLVLRTAGHTPGLPAYEALLRGRYHLFKFTPDSWQRAKACFEQAIELDPLYAQPLATLGVGYLLAEANGFENLRIAAPRIRALAERALALEPSEPEPRFLLGSVAAAHDYDWAESLRQFRAAYATATVSADARWAYASLYLQPLGRNNESEQAYAAAPWHGNIVGIYAGLLAQAGQAARGEEIMHGLEGASANPFSRVFFHVLRSEVELAADWYERAIEQRELFALICAPSEVIRPLRESPRWRRLALLMNLQAASRSDLHP